MKLTRPRNKVPRTAQIKSIRMNRDDWECVEDRAKQDGLTVSRAVYLLAWAYSRELIDLPPENPSL